MTLVELQRQGLIRHNDIPTTKMPALASCLQHFTYCHAHVRFSGHTAVVVTSGHEHHPCMWDSSVLAQASRTRPEENEVSTDMKATRASTKESSAMDRSAPAHSLHVVVDLNRCQGYAQCCFLASGVFQLHGEEALWYDPSPDPGQLERVQRAAAACPVQAITVEGESAMTRRHRTHPGHIEHREQREEPHATQRT